MRYVRGGVVVRQSTEQTKRGEAEAFLNSRLDPQRPVLRHADKVVVDDLLADYERWYMAKHRDRGARSLAFIQRCTVRLLDYFGGWRVTRITPAEITGYVRRRQEIPCPRADERKQGKKPQRTQGYAGSTINRDLAILRKALRLGKRHGKVVLVPEFDRQAEAVPRQGFIGEVDFLALEAALPAYLRLPLTFAFTFGWRKTAVFTLTWNKVDLREGRVELDARYSKNHQPVMVHLPPDLAERFRRHWQVTVKLVRSRKPDATPQEIREAVPWVFHHGGRPIRDFRKPWKKAVTAIGRPGLVPHDLCRSSARNLSRHGIDREVAMTLMGRRTDAIYKRYRIVDEEDLKEAAAKLAGPVPFASALLSAPHQDSQDRASLASLAEE